MLLNIKSLMVVILSIVLTQTSYALNYLQQQGWFFYKKEPVNQAKTPQKLTAGWVKQQLPRFLNLAIDQPSHDNVAQYLLLQAYSQLQAQQFAEQANLITKINPWLDNQGLLNSLNPQLTKSIALQASQQLLQQLGQELVLFWYLLPNDPLNHLMFKPLQELRKHGIAVIGVNLSPNQPPLDLIYQAVDKLLIDQGQAQQLGINQGMSFAIATAQSQDFISRGLLSYQDLQQRIIAFALSKGLITPSQYKLSQGSMIESPDLQGLEQQLQKMLNQANGSK